MKYFYNNPDPDNVAWLLDRAIGRDSRLNEEEAQARDDAIKECYFGKNWMRRAHP